MLNKLSLALLWLLALTPSVHAQSAKGSRDINSFKLEIGEQVVVPANGVKSYSEGTPGIVDIRLTGDASRFVVVGTHQGSSTLLCIMFDGSEKLYTFQVGDPVSENGMAAANDLAVRALQNIRLDLYFVQVDRKRSTDFGVKAPTELGFFNLDVSHNLFSALTSKSAVIGSSLAPALDAAQSRGWAKLSRHVTVITTNGQPASFNSGGEFNGTTAAGVTSSVFSVKYGSKIEVVPRYDEESGRIELKVSAEVSDLAATGSPVPGRSLSHVETVSNLALGESLALAGLSAYTASRTRVGLPWLSQIPVIGLLFGKQTDTSNETENVVFIAPSVVDPLKPARAREFLANALHEFDDYTGSSKPHGVFPGAPFAIPTSTPPRPTNPAQR